MIQCQFLYVNAANQNTTDLMAAQALLQSGTKTQFCYKTIVLYYTSHIYINVAVAEATWVVVNPL